MKKAFLIVTTILILTGFAKADSEARKRAFEAAGACSSVVRFDDENFYLGFGTYKLGFEEPREAIPGSLNIVPIADPSKIEALHTQDSVIGSVRDGNTLFILTYSGIEEWDLNSKAAKAIYPTWLRPGVFAYMEHAQGFARYQDKLIVAHGRLGVSIFSLKTRHVANQIPLLQRQLPRESMAVDVAVVGSRAYVLLDNFTLGSNDQRAFRGIVVIDLTTEKVIAEMDGIDPGADGLAVEGDSLIVSFGGLPIWKYSLSSLSGSKMPEPDQRVWRFPVKGHPVGHAVVDENYYYTCFLKEPTKPGGHYVSAPIALDRKVLLLDSVFAPNFFAASDDFSMKFNGGDLLLNGHWTQGPRTPEESLLRLEWKNSKGVAVEPPGTFKVALFMPDMGHGSAPTQMQRVLDGQGKPLVGVYQVSNIYFSMGGRWEVRVSLKKPDGSQEMQAIRVEFPEGGDGHHHH